jgi:hypothetical protein
MQFINKNNIKELAAVNYITKQSLFSILFAGLLAVTALGQNTAKINFADLEAINKPLPFKVENSPVRVPFQKQVTVNPNGLGNRIVAMQIPAGKRFVIENVSVIVRCPEIQRIEVNYFTYSNNGGNIAEKALQKLTLERRGSFNNSAIFTAKNKGLVFADEQIGTEHFSVGVSARLINRTDGYGQAQFTFSGYLEDLPAVQ